MFDSRYADWSIRLFQLLNMRDVVPRLDVLQTCESDFQFGTPVPLIKAIATQPRVVGATVPQGKWTVVLGDTLEEESEDSKSGLASLGFLCIHLA